MFIMNRNYYLMTIVTLNGGRLHAIIPPQQIGRIMSNIELARIDENNFIQVFDLKLAESKSNLFQIQSGV